MFQGASAQEEVVTATDQDPEWIKEQVLRLTRPVLHGEGCALLDGANSRRPRVCSCKAEMRAKEEQALVTPALRAAIARGEARGLERAAENHLCPICPVAEHADAAADFDEWCRAEAKRLREGR